MFVFNSFVGWNNMILNEKQYNAWNQALQQKTQLHLPTSVFQVICLIQSIISRHSRHVPPLCCAFHQLPQMAQAESACLSRCDLQILAEDRGIVLLQKNMHPNKWYYNKYYINHLVVSENWQHQKNDWFPMKFIVSNKSKASVVLRHRTHPTKTVTLSISTGFLRIKSIKASRK